MSLTHSFGRDMMYVIPKCAVRTEGGAISFNSEDWSNLPMQIEVLQQSSYYPEHCAAASIAPYGYLDLTATTNVAPGIQHIYGGLRAPQTLT